MPTYQAWLGQAIHSHPSNPFAIIPDPIMSGWFTTFTNCRYALNGSLIDDHLVISDETGLILKREGYIGGELVDLDDNIIAPGYLELHTNGANGFHFTHFEDQESYKGKIDGIARHYVTQGVTGFWATLPTIKEEEFQQVRWFMYIISLMIV